MGERSPGNDRELDRGTDRYDNRARSDRPGEARLTMAEAAGVLGISKDGVRMRVRRDKLRSEKGEDGKVYVFLDQTAGATGGTYANADRDAVPPRSPDDPSRELVQEMRDRIEDLRDQLRREQDAHAEARRIIAGLVQRVPELEAPIEERRGSPPRPEEGPEATPGDTPSGPETRTVGPEGGPRRPWWRRLLGG